MAGRTEKAMEQPVLYGDGDDPIIINSGYRSSEVNKAVGGVKGSNHLTGCAADIRVAGIEQLVRYATILLDISDESQEDFDELLFKFIVDNGCKCVYVSVIPQQLDVAA